MSNTYNSRIITKTDTYANWTAANPVLLNGELVAVTGYTYVFEEISATADFGVQFKFGDGTTAFNDLPFINEGMVDAIADLSWRLLTSVVVYVGTTTPAGDVGNDGDLYVQLS